MARTQRLEETDLVELDAVFRALHGHVDGLRRSSKVGHYIAWPKLPNALTEGLVCLAAPAIFGAGVTAALGGGVADVVVTDQAGGVCRVEVKGTGPAGFGLLTERDVHADVLVWVDYGPRLRLGSPSVTLWVIPRPAGLLSSGRAMLPRVLANVPEASRRSVILALTDSAIGVRSA